MAAHQNLVLTTACILAALSTVVFTDSLFSKSLCISRNCESCSDNRIITWKFWFPYTEIPTRPVRIMFRKLSTYTLNESLPHCSLDDILKEKIHLLEASKSLAIVLALNLVDNETFNLPFPGGFQRFSKAHSVVNLSVFGASLSGDTLCPLENLRRLRLEANRIQNTSFIGCQSCCDRLEQLTLTQNGYDITNLNLMNLTNLEIRSHIRTIDGTALRDMGNLVEFSLRFATLKTDLPSNLLPESVETVHIDYTNIDTIPEDFFKGLNRLKVLTLSNNDIQFTNQTERLFQYLQNLKVLDLKRNSMKTIPDNLFVHFKVLQILDMSHNQLKFTNETTLALLFDRLNFLEELDLSWNKIGELNGDMFESLKNLKKLNLEHNKISTLHLGTFRHLEQLESLSLRSNLINFSKYAPPLFASLANLRILDLRRNRLHYVNDNIFHGLTQLVKLDLAFNSIEFFVNGTFRSQKNLTRLILDLNGLKSIGREFTDLSSLQELHLAFNDIQNISGDALCNSHHLKFVDLRWNSLKTAIYKTQDGTTESHFRCLSDLEVLKLSRNRLQEFDYSMIPSSLTTLEISNNKIGQLTDRWNERGRSNLTHLDASKNYIGKLTNESFAPSIRFVDLYLNNLSSIESHTFSELYQLQKISLLETELRVIDRFALGPTPDEWRTFLNVTFHITTDKTKWNRHLVGQMRKLSSSLENNPETVFDVPQCFTLNKKILKFEVNAHKILSEEVVCQHKHSVEHYVCVDSSSANVTLDVLQPKPNLVVDCGFQTIPDIPSDLPLNVTRLFLDGGSIPTLKANHFKNFPFLEVLYLNNSNIESMHEDTFQGLSHLKELHLENNNLKESDGKMFDNLAQLKRLYLEGNPVYTVIQQHLALQDPIATENSSFVQGMDDDLHQSI